MTEHSSNFAVWKVINILCCIFFPPLVPFTFRIYLNELAQELGKNDRFEICTLRVFAEMLAMCVLCVLLWIPAVVVAFVISFKREAKLKNGIIL